MVFYSIITVSFNNIEGLKKTVRSVLGQNFGDFEYIVIDGGSSDGSYEFLSGTKGSKLNFVSEKDSGIYNAMNKGLEKANGKYVIFMNSGDAFHNQDVLMNVYAFLNEKRSEFSIAYGKSCEIHEGEQVVKPARDIDKVSYGMVTHHQAMFFNTKLAQQQLYDESYQIAADYDLFCRLYMLNNNVAKLDVTICDFEEAGLSGDKFFKGAWEAFKIKKKVLGISLLRALVYFFAAVSANVVKKYIPGLYRMVRYEK